MLHLYLALLHHSSSVVQASTHSSRIYLSPARVRVCVRVCHRRQQQASLLVLCSSSCRLKGVDQRASRFHGDSHIDAFQMQTVRGHARVAAAMLAAAPIKLTLLTAVMRSFLLADQPHASVYDQLATPLFISDGACTAPTTGRKAGLQRDREAAAGRSGGWSWGSGRVGAAR